MIRVVRHLLLLAVLGAFALPASAQADPVSDCNNDGKLDQSYTNEQLKRALDNIPSDVDEYTNCRELIGAAITSGSDKGENRPGSGASASSNGADNGGDSPAEQEARTKDNAELEAITGDSNESAPSVRLDGEEVEPGSRRPVRPRQRQQRRARAVAGGADRDRPAGDPGRVRGAARARACTRAHSAPVQDSACFVPPIPALTPARMASVRS